MTCCHRKCSCKCHSTRVCQGTNVITFDGLSQTGVRQNTPFNVTYTISKANCVITVQFPAFTFTLTSQGTIITSGNSIPIGCSPSSVVPLSFPVNFTTFPVGTPTGVLQINNVGQVTIRGINNGFLPAGTYTVSPTTITYPYAKRKRC